MLRMNIFVRGWMIKQYEGVERRIKALQGMIDKELAARE